MSNGYLDSIRELLTDEDTPQRVSNRILFGALMEIYHRMSKDDQLREELIEKLESISKQLDGLERRVKGLEERQSEAPSLIWLLQHQPRQTIRTMIIVLVIVLLVLALSEPLRLLVMTIAGVSP